MKWLSWLIVVAMLCWSGPASAEVEHVFGTVADAVSGEPLADVRIWADDDSQLSAADGGFSLATMATHLIVRKPGYLPQKVPVSFPLHLTLQPITPKALYLSYWAAASQDLRNHLLQLLADTGMNALVIDLKSSRGDIAFRTGMPLSVEVGAQRARTLKDLPELLAELKEHGIYTIARIVVFKDNRLAKGRPELAVRTEAGSVWEDREKMSWCDPFQEEVWDYNIALAEEAARLGFDEIQFDYIRFPAKSDLLFSRENTGDNRVAAINGFLARARQRLAAYPVMTSANIFGYICWKPKDQKIGQRLADLAEYVDYLSPMLYPSGFPNGIPGYRNPVANSYAVIADSLRQAALLTGLAPQRFRPWLQAFRDYAFDHRSFTAAEINAQINASNAGGSHGWMLWNAASRYTQAGLQQVIPYGELNLVDASPKAGDSTVLSRSESKPQPLPTM